MTARVSKRWQDRDPLPPTVWRRQVYALAKWMLICVALMLLAAWGVSYA